MSNIQGYLDKIKNARFGKDVRNAILNAIRQCYEDGKAGAIDLVAREEIEELKANGGGSGATAEQIQQIKNHINDNTVHTTKEEKNSWNKTAVDLKGVAGLVNITKERVDNLSEEIVNYLPKNQGSGNVGKILVVGTDGNLTLANMPEGGTSGDVIGTLDESNNILLTGNLADGTYTLKYENEDGTYTDVGSLVVGEIIPEPTNLFVVGGDGYILNGRCSSTGVDRTDSNGCIVTNYIKVSKGDTVYMNKDIVSATGAYSGMKLIDGSVEAFLPSNTEYITNLSTSNGITQFTVNNANADYIRICINIDYGTALTETDVVNAGVIVTVNEPLS